MPLHYMLPGRFPPVQGHPEEVYACEFLDQSHLLTASADRLFVWDMELGTCVHEVSCTPGPLDQGQLSTALAMHILTSKHKSQKFLCQVPLSSQCMDDRPTTRKMAARLYL